MRDYIIKIKNGNEIRIDKMKAESARKAEQYWKERGERAIAIAYDADRMKAICEAAKKEFSRVILSPSVSTEIL